MVELLARHRGDRGAVVRVLAGLEQLLGDTDEREKLTR
jgi:hypothetical protein